MFAFLLLTFILRVLDDRFGVGFVYKPDMLNHKEISYLDEEFLHSDPSEHEHLFTNEQCSTVNCTPEHQVMGKMHTRVNCGNRSICKFFEATCVHLSINEGENMKAKCKSAQVPDSNALANKHTYS